jgi:arylsulfatase A-like enzyme
LDASIPTLAEALQRAGYRTLGISENPFVGPHTGLTKGFEKFILRASDEEPPVPEHVAAFLDADKTKPFFCFINLLSCHQPYTNAGDCLGMYLSDPAYRDRCGYDFFTELAKEKLDETWLTHLGEHYDATVRHADQLTQAIVGVVEKRNLLDSTMLVVTSDHGENLGEHGLLEHQMCLYQTVVSIPLLVRFPEGREAGKTVKRPVQLVDIAPTVAEITQVPLRISNCQGASLLSPENGENRVVFLENYRHAAFGRCKDLQGIKLPPPEILNNPRVVACNRRLKSVVRTDLGLKLVVGTDGSRLGYDLTKDPEEKHSVADDPNFRRQFEDLEKAMQAATSRFVTRPDNDDDKAPVSKDTVELLKSIGYL